MRVLLEEEEGMEVTEGRTASEEPADDRPWDEGVWQKQRRMSAAVRVEKCRREEWRKRCEDEEGSR